MLGQDDDNAITAAISAATSLTVSGVDWETQLYDQLAGNNALLHRIVQDLRKPKALDKLCQELAKELGRTLDEAEVLLWLALGAAARREGRPLVRPVLHVFIRDIAELW